MNIALEGRLDSNTTVQLEKELRGRTDDISELVIDLEKLVYISSSGLRLFLGIHKALKGNMRIIRANDDVRQVFEVTGLCASLNLE